MRAQGACAFHRSISFEIRNRIAKHRLHASVADRAAGKLGDPPSRRPGPKVGNPRRQLQQLHLRLDLGVAQLRIEPLSVSHHISPWHTGNTVAKS